MNNKPALIAAVLLLGMFYLYVLSLIFRPEVSDAYYRYYISRESQLSPNQLADLPQLELNASHRFDTRQVVFEGWSDAEAEFRWSVGNSPSIHFNPVIENPGVQDYELLLEFHSLGEQQVSIDLNGQPIASFSTANSDVTQYQFEIPAELINTSHNILSFNLPNARRPGNGDMRELGLALHSFALNE
jgi:hypothetical protein